MSRICRLIGDEICVGQEVIDSALSLELKAAESLQSLRLYTGQLIKIDEDFHKRKFKIIMTDGTQTGI